LEAGKFTRQSWTEAIKRYAAEKEQVEDEAERDEAALRSMISTDDGGDVSRIRLPSGSSDAGAEAGHHGSATKEVLPQEFGISASTLDRVSTILNEGTKERI